MRSVGYGVDGTQRAGTTQADAVAAIRTGGLLALPGLFDAALVRDVHAELTPGLAASDRCEVGPGRFLVAPRLTGALLDERLLACPPLWALAEELLGQTASIASVSVVVSEPGSAPQIIHADAMTSPGNGLTVAIPLAPIPAGCGRTCFWAGSQHRVGVADLDGITEVSPEATPGDALIWDWRLFHRGTPNTSTESRPMLFLAIANNWHRDPNYDRRMFPPIDIDLERFVRAPVAVRIALRRAAFAVLGERFAVSSEVDALEIEDPLFAAFVARLQAVPAPRLRDALRVGTDLGLEALYCTELLHELASADAITFESGSPP